MDGEPKNTRLPDDWELPANYRHWALEHIDKKLQLDIKTSNELVEDLADEFKDYWISATRNALKRDWAATWRNRVRSFCLRDGWRVKKNLQGQEKQAWQLSDDELLAQARARGIATHGQTRNQIVAQLEAKH
jgi:hypothetical protein